MEFDLIRKYFSEPFSALALSNQSRVLLGIGDDCAVIKPIPDQHLYISTDTSVAGVHFFEDEDPWSIGWKSLAVNLSDLAASGARPLAFTLNLSLPRVDQTWLAGFSQGLLKQAELANCPLVGGDTTSSRPDSPLVISITVFGERHSQSNSLTRSAAHLGDQIWVTGIPGLARLGLLQRYEQLGRLHTLLDQPKQALFQQTWASLPIPLQQLALTRLTRPVVRSHFGLQASPWMHAVLDLSDGLSGDLQHIAQASQKTLVLHTSSLQAMWTGALGSNQVESNPSILNFLLETSIVGGDDYELCFTAAPSNADSLMDLANSMQVPLSVLGLVRATESLQHGVVIESANGQQTALRSNSFNHFAP